MASKATPNLVAVTIANAQLQGRHVRREGIVTALRACGVLGGLVAARG